MKLPFHAQQQDAAESGPAHSEQHRDNIILQEIDEVSRADLSVEVDTESLQVDVPQQCHLPAVTMMIMMIPDTDDDNDN